MLEISYAGLFVLTPLVGPSPVPLVGCVAERETYCGGAGGETDPVFQRVRGGDGC